MLRSRTCLGMGLGVLLLGCGNATEIAGTPFTGPDVPSGSCTTASYHAEQGRLLQGSRGSSFTLEGISLGCGNVSSLHVEGAELVAVNGGTVVRGADFVGAMVSMRDAQGLAATARVTGIVRDDADPTGATFLYTLSYLDPLTGTAISACLPDRKGVAAALPLRGRWDTTGAKQDGETAISLGCTSGALAKCVRWGYRPWESVNGTSLVDYHQACTRMARADYCGNGTSFTQDGTPIDIYDRLPVLTRDPSLLSIFESSWTPNGAYCVARERWLNLFSLLPTTCSAKFELAIEATPVSLSDLCLVKRNGALPAEALINNSTGINIKL